MMKVGHAPCQGSCQAGHVYFGNWLPPTTQLCRAFLPRPAKGEHAPQPRALSLNALHLLIDKHATLPSLLAMDRRTFEGPMDWEYQSQPPVDLSSPFAKFSQKPSTCELSQCDCSGAASSCAPPVQLSTAHQSLPPPRITSHRP